MGEPERSTDELRLREMDRARAWPRLQRSRNVFEIIVAALVLAQHLL